MKIKEFGPQGSARPWRPLGSSNASETCNFFRHSVISLLGLKMDDDRFFNVIDGKVNKVLIGFMFFRQRGNCH